MILSDYGTWEIYTFYLSSEIKTKKLIMSDEPVLLSKGLSFDRAQKLINFLFEQENTGLMFVAVSPSTEESYDVLTGYTDNLI